MKRYPNTTILLSYMLVLLTTCFLLTLVSFKSKKQRLFKVPVIINTNKKTNLCLSPNFMMKAQHAVERIEKFQDTLDITTEPKSTQAKFYANTPKNPDAYFNDGGIKIIVDTQNEIGVNVREGMSSVLGFPVYIVNQGTHKTASIETHNGKLNMVVEAVSSKNAWEPIEYVSNDNTNNQIMNLPPQHYAFTQNIVHCGDHLTLCRLKLMSGGKVYYSNQFWMGLNYTQFSRS